MRYWNPQSCRREAGGLGNHDNLVGGCGCGPAACPPDDLRGSAASGVGVDRFEQFAVGSRANADPGRLHKRPEHAVVRREGGAGHVEVRVGQRHVKRAARDCAQDLTGARRYRKGHGGVGGGVPRRDELSSTIKKLGAHQRNVLAVLHERGPRACARRRRVQREPDFRRRPTGLDHVCRETGAARRAVEGLCRKVAWRKRHGWEGGLCDYYESYGWRTSA